MSNSHIPWPIMSPGCPKTVPVSSPAFSFLLSYQNLGVFHSFIVLDTDFIHAPKITCSGFPKALCVLYSESSWRHIIYWVIFLVSGVISQVSSILSKEVMICFFFIPLNINLYLKCSHRFYIIQFPSRGNTVSSATPSPAPSIKIRDALGLPSERGINDLSMLVWESQGCL